MEDQDALIDVTLRHNAMEKALALAAILGPNKDKTHPSYQDILTISQAFYSFLKGETK